MSSRYYLSRMVGGTHPETDPRRAKAMNYSGVNASIVHREGKASALCLVETANHLAFALDTDVDDLPDTALDTVLTALSLLTRDALKSDLQKHGFSAATQNLVDTGSLRDVVRGAGREMEASFLETNLKVSV